ncbi:MAG: hypothetical protein PUI46_11855 [Lachnospiraceae bacterium]|nr:hypothetical protein [Lachnospiraceae bacterium]MDY5699837.1 hypothetical protein [Lachnospiraceae bacterium]
MRDFLLKKNLNNELMYVSDLTKGYSLLLEKETLLTKKYNIQSTDGEQVASIDYKHILFEKAKLPQLKIFCRDGHKAVVKREIEQLCDTINISGQGLLVKGDVFSDKFKLILNEKYIAIYSWENQSIRVAADSDNEVLAIAIAFSIELAK